jgi:hypothetical protein
MLISTMFLVLTCPKSKILNDTEYYWNNHDEKILNVAKNRCGELYKNAPCVKTFTKVGKKDYLVTCGAEKIRINDVK